MRARRFVATAVSTALAASVGLVLTGFAPASAGDRPANGVNPVEDGQEIEAGAGYDGNKETIPINGKFTPRRSGPNNICMDGVPGEWQRWGSEPWHASFPAPSRPANVPDDAEFWILHCPQLASLEAPGIGDSGWSGTGGPPLPPLTAQDIVLPAWAYVKGLLKNPSLTLEPPAAVASVVNLPTFVAIGNPQPPTRYTASEDGVQVWIDVIPTVTLHPGEPGAPAIPCDVDGSTFVRSAGTPRAQAAGACAHIYQHRSATGGWPGDVTITWNITWGSNQAGQNGTFDAAASVTGFQRQVDEVQGVVTDPG